MCQMLVTVKTWSFAIIAIVHSVDGSQMIFRCDLFPSPASHALTYMCSEEHRRSNATICPFLEAYDREQALLGKHTSNLNEALVMT